MIDDGDHLSVYLDNIEIKKGEDKYVLPLSDIGVIVLDGMMTSITTRLLSTCSNYNVVLVICDKKHMPCGMYLPFNQHSRAVKVIRRQVAWTDDRKDKLWQQIIRFKIYNQSKILYYFTKNKDRYLQLQAYIEEVEKADKTNREGHSAKVYFNSLFGNDFYRSLDCIENAMLNYGYAIFRAYISRVIVGYGYNPSIGIFHKSEYNSFSLADDFIEVFRPIIDAYTIDYILKSEQPVECLTQEIRGFLVDLLNKRVRYDRQYQKISTVINKFILQCLDYLDPEKESKNKIINFEITTIEGLEK